MLEETFMNMVFIFLYGFDITHDQNRWGEAQYFSCHSWWSYEFMQNGVYDKGYESWKEMCLYDITSFKKMRESREARKSKLWYVSASYWKLIQPDIVSNFILSLWCENIAQKSKIYNNWNVGYEVYQLRCDVKRIITIYHQGLHVRLQ